LANIAASKDQADARWHAFQLAKKQAAERRIVFFIPDNEYHAQDLFELLLKRTADPPTCTVSTQGRPTLQRFSPGLEFRSQYDGSKHVDDRNVLYAWNEAPGLPPVESFFPELKRALREREGPARMIDLKTGHRFFILDVAA